MNELLGKQSEETRQKMHNKNEQLGEQHDQIAKLLKHIKKFIAK